MGFCRWEVNKRFADARDPFYISCIKDAVIDMVGKSKLLCELVKGVGYGMVLVGYFLGYDESFVG